MSDLVSEPADRAAWTVSIYGTISVAVVVAEYASTSVGKLAMIVLGYGCSLWLAHSYASVVSAASPSWPASLQHSWPVAEAAAPALGGLLLAAGAGWSTRVAVVLALIGCLGNLVAIQVQVLRVAGLRPRRRLVASVVLDVVAGAVVILVLTLLR